MRMKLGLVLGFAAGYLMGTKAGRYRYEQIMKFAKQFWGSEPAATARAKASSLVEEVQSKAIGRLRSVDRDGAMSSHPSSMVLP
jgi:hypothetical protein